MRPALVLTGGPAVGKSTTARLLARTLARAAVIEVDDIRQLVVSGAAAPWKGAEGLAQQRLGAENACGLARRLHTAGFDVVLTDVVTPATAAVYRRNLTGCVIVRLSVSIDEARRRAATRPVHLTDAEFHALHERDRAAPPAVDHEIDVTDLSVDRQVAIVSARWTPA